jgi:hypothetical protein
MDGTTRPSLLTARIIAGSFVLGVVLFWVVVWVVRSAGGRSGEDVSPAAELQVWIWAAVALTNLTGALFFRGRALQVVEGRRTGSRPPGVEILTRVQANLIIAWALVEAPAILAGVFFFLSGAVQILFAAAPVFAVGMALTFPRAEWFGRQ